MAEIFRAEESASDALDAAEHALETGGCVVLPTDTVYGIAARPDVPGATDLLFDLKRRPHDLTLPVLVAGTADAEVVAVLDDRAMGLAHRFWPGALTMVLRRSPASMGWDLGAERESIGVRVPAHGLAVALLARTGPLAVSSANLSGQATPVTCESVRDALGEGVAVYICADSVPDPVPSTIIDLAAGEPRILRAGGIPPGDLTDAIGRPEI